MTGQCTAWWDWGARWRKVIRANNGHPRFLLYLLAVVSIWGSRCWSLSRGGDFTHERAGRLFSHPSIFLGATGNIFLDCVSLHLQCCQTHTRSGCRGGMNAVHDRSRPVPCLFPLAHAPIIEGSICGLTCRGRQRVESEEAALVCPQRPRRLFSSTKGESAADRSEHMSAKQDL